MNHQTQNLITNEQLIVCSLFYPLKLALPHLQSPENWYLSLHPRLQLALQRCTNPAEAVVFCCALSSFLQRFSPCLCFWFPLAPLVFPSLSDIETRSEAGYLCVADWLLATRVVQLAQIRTPCTVMLSHPQFLRTSTPFSYPQTNPHILMQILFLM